MTHNKINWTPKHHGIDFVPTHEQTAKPAQLFWIWCAANIGMLGILYGAIIMSFGLSFFQAILVMILGLSTFTFVGITGIAGFKGRTNTLTLSRRAFGYRGNLIPTCFTWVYLMGWESINLIIGTLTLLTLCQQFGINPSPWLMLICLTGFASLIILVSLLGLHLVMYLQKILTQVFGGLTLLIVLYILWQADWPRLFALPNGNWFTGFLPAVSIIMAGTGIGWTIASADYSRTLHPSTRYRSIFIAIIGGAGLPLVLLMLAGIVLSFDQPNLAHSNNPIMMIQQALPKWMSIPYLIAAIGSMITLGILSLYSASLTILSLGLKVKPKYAVGLNAILVLSVAGYVLFVSQHFIGLFMNFLFFCGLVLSAWSSIFIIDFLLKPNYSATELFEPSSVQFPALFCWLIGIIMGLLVTKEGFINGFFAIGIFENSKLGLLITFLVSAFTYFIYRIKILSNTTYDQPQ